MDGDFTNCARAYERKRGGGGKRREVNQTIRKKLHFYRPKFRFLAVCELVWKPQYYQPISELSLQIQLLPSHCLQVNK